jgi:hypothetical protein
MGSMHDHKTDIAIALAALSFLVCSAIACSTIYDGDESDVAAPDDEESTDTTESDDGWETLLDTTDEESDDTDTTAETGPSESETGTTETGDQEMPACCRCTWNIVKCDPWVLGEQACLESGDLFMSYDPHCLEGWTETHEDDWKCDVVCF